MSRLDRLVSLLDTGFSSYVRNVAAEQIADVQKSRPEELFNLLARVTPYLQSPKWDTRIAAARAVGLIAEKAPWDPIAEEEKEKEKQEIANDFNGADSSKPALKVEPNTETSGEPTPSETPSLLPGEPKEDEDLLSFDQLDITNVILKGTPLLGSAGREYDQAVQRLDSEHRLRMQQQTLKKKIGLEFLSDDDTRDFMEQELLSQQQHQNAKNEVKGEIKDEVKEEIKEEEEPKPEPKPEPVNARLRALAKRKARFGSPQAPSPKRKPEEDSKSKTKPSQTNIKGSSGKSSNGSGTKPGSSGDKVVVEHKEKSDELVAALTVSDPRVFPFEELCYRLVFDMFEPTWETRHGALLCLRELVRVHGKRAGMVRGASVERNVGRNRRWLEDLACRLCCIFALDRFADYVADQAVAPVRESCAQTLGALLLDLPEDVARKTFGVLQTLVMDPENAGSWAASHGGLLGLRYFVTLRFGLIVDDRTIFSQLVNCVIKGLTGSNDDEVQAISAAVLLPIATEFVERRPAAEVAKLLDIMWDGLSDLRDELSVSVGSLMDLLAKLSTFPQVLKILLESQHGSLAHLVPKLYPFLRHSIVDVRKSVLRSLKTFLTIDGSKDWVSLVTLRVLFQNVLLEQNEAVLEQTVELWQLLMDFFLDTTENGAVPGAVPFDFDAFWPAAFGLYSTPIGSARRFYKMDSKLLIRPSGETYAASAPASATTVAKLDVNIDGPMIQGDTLVVEPHVFIRAKVNAAVTLGRAAAVASVLRGDIPPAFVTDTATIFDSHMSSQHLALGLLLEEFGRYLPPGFAALPGFAKASGERLLSAMSLPGPKRTTESAMLWRDINPILRAVRTQCQSLFTMLMSQGELEASLLPKLPSAIEGDPGSDGASVSDVFTLAQSRQLATTTFYEIRDQLSAETQVRMAEVLESGRRNLVSSIEEAEASLENRNTSIRASAAAAYLALHHDTLPTKLNPIIRSLMDEIKMEMVPLLHDRTSRVLANLVAVLVESERPAIGAKIVKNLCAFLCVDVHEAPEFDGSTQNAILSLQRDDIKLDNKNVAEMLRKERETRVAFIKRQGAVLTLSKLCARFGNDLFTLLPELRTQITSFLAQHEKNEGKVDKKRGQGIIDNLAVLRTLLPYFAPALHAEVAELLPAVGTALYSPYPVVRHVAARCVAVICQTMPTAGITWVVREVLGRSLVDASSRVRRAGAIEAVFHCLLAMGEQILPYIVFFIVPVLGRMSDSDQHIRMIAATAFASIIKLVPLESGVSDPPDIPPELLRGKEKEREFIGQMMDPTQIQEFALPIAVNAELRRYQQEGINWLAFLNKYNLHGILCDDMGLGKTLQTICMVAADHVNRRTQHAVDPKPETRRLPSLIVCPTTLTGHWVEEFHKYVPSLKVEALVGSPRSRQYVIDSGRIETTDIVIVSYDTARNEVAKLAAKDWNYCVLDEGHIIKNANSKLSRAVKQYKAHHRLVLTGTPIQNNVLELWSLFDFLMPGFLGNEKSFNERFSKPIAARSSGKASPKDQEAATLALEALHKQVLPFTLRRLKEDVLDDLPPKIIQDYYCDLSDEQRKLYARFTQRERAEIETDTVAAVEDGRGRSGDAARHHIFQSLQYMRKLCNHPAFVTYTRAELERRPTPNATESPKLMALQQLLKDCGIGNLENPADGVPEAMSQHRALIFCQQREMLDLVEKSLLNARMPSVSYLRMDGSIPGPARQKMVTKFNDDPSIDVLLLTTHVGGLGLNLTGADTVIFVEHDWNPMNDLQAMDRAHRLGQKKTVNVYRLITRHTLEERIMGLQQFKMNVASSVINQQNKGLMSMGTDQILELFSASVDQDAPPPEHVADVANVDATGKPQGKNDVMSGLGELWDEAEYAEEYNIDKFISSLKK